ncbi:hypothetical protein E4T56_gene3541 [Termitomyces sp. T112]|nr:hypothetical protein E4T56_gene3541 [Termitomyces sp. T112]
MEVEYLGVIVTPNSMRMDPTKVDAILNWPPPWNVKEVQSFLGFANFYCCFIDNYSGITKPLNQLTQKDTPWDWDSKCQSIFLLLKKAFTSALVLHHFDPSLPIMLKCDASNYATTGILSQSDLGGKDLCPVAFYTQSMIPAELNYNIYDKELLAIVEAFCQWQAYLKGSLHCIQVYSDHNNLQYFMTMKQLSRCQAQWSKTLSEYDFTIHYHPGQLSTKTDALTQRSNVTSPPTPPTKLPRTSDSFTNSSGMRSTPPIKPTPNMLMPDVIPPPTGPPAPCALWPSLRNQMSAHTTLPAAAPSLPSLRLLLHWTPTEFPASPTPLIVAPPPPPAPPMAPYALTALEAATVAPWLSLQSLFLSSPTLQTSAPHVANNLSNSSTQYHRKASATNHDPPTDFSTKAPEVGEYTAPPLARGTPSVYPCCTSWGPPPSTHPAGAQPSSGAASCQLPPLLWNPSLRPYPSDPPPTAQQPTHGLIPALPQCKWHANSE